MQLRKLHLKIKKKRLRNDLNETNRKINNFKNKEIEKLGTRKKQKTV